MLCSIAFLNVFKADLEVLNWNDKITRWHPKHMQISHALHNDVREGGVMAQWRENVCAIEIVYEMCIFPLLYWFHIERILLQYYQLSYAQPVRVRAQSAQPRVPSYTKTNKESGFESGDIEFTNVRIYSRNYLSFFIQFFASCSIFILVGRMQY